MSAITMQIRQHKGSLEESVATMKTIPATLEGIHEYMLGCEQNKVIPFTQKELDSVEIKLYHADDETRINGWNGATYLITYSPQPHDTPALANSPVRGVFGMCSKYVEHSVDWEESVMDQEGPLTVINGEAFRNSNYLDLLQATSTGDSLPPMPVVGEPILEIDIDASPESAVTSLYMGNIDTPVYVKFPMSQENWEAIIENAGEDEEVTPEVERQDYSIVRYPSELHYGRALVRMEGMVEHEVLEDYQPD